LSESTTFDSNDDSYHHETDDGLDHDCDQDAEDAIPSSNTVSSTPEVNVIESLQPWQQLRIYTQPVILYRRTPCKRTPQNPGHYIEIAKSGVAHVALFNKTNRCEAGHL
jgi:hypothetical protein